MAYFKINNIDFSMYVNELKISSIKMYNSQTNASGNTVIDYINTKREVSVGIIPLNDDVMKDLQTAIENVDITISFRNTKTGYLETINCILPDDEVEYYTIQADKVQYKAFVLRFIEL